MIVHVDMDAFFASCERVDDPALTGQPVIVGHRGPRGVVSTCSYEARAFGVHSAMASTTAERLCPQAVWIRPRIARYAEISHHIRDIFHRCTPDVMPVSIDEAYLDLAGTESLFGPPEETARRLQLEILRETGLTASVGVAPVMFLAKIASDMNKPNGFVVVRDGEVEQFLAPLPVGRLWGVGPATQARLERFGIHRIGQLAACPPDWLRREFGTSGQQLHELAHGIDRRRVAAGTARSVSHETTFPADIRAASVLRAAAAELAEQTAWRLRREGRQGRTITLKVRFADFRTLTRSRTLPRATDLTQEIRHEALRLLAALAPLQPVRLLGVAVSGFAEAPPQADLFADPTRDKQARLDAALDRIQERFGPAAARRGPRP